MAIWMQNEPRPPTQLHNRANVVASFKVFNLLCVASLALIFSINVSMDLPLTIARNSGR